MQYFFSTINFWVIDFAKEGFGDFLRDAEYLFFCFKVFFSLFPPRIKVVGFFFCVQSGTNTDNTFFLQKFSSFK